MTVRDREFRLFPVGNVAEKPVIGIIGGIGSGKSTVAAEFAKLGCGVIDADKIAHGLLDLQPVKEKITAFFGQAVLDNAGRIDRRKLAGLAFCDSEKLSFLNETIHPLVLEQAEKLIDEYRRQSHVKAIVLDIPLLLEVGWAQRCDRLIFVDSEENLRKNRAKKMGFDENHLKIRENFQISLDKKFNLADNTVENNSDFSALVRQVADIFSDIMDNG